MRRVSFPKTKKDSNDQSFLQFYYASKSIEEQASMLENEMASIQELQSQIEMRQQRVIAIKIAQSEGK